MMATASNPSYFGGRYQRDCSEDQSGHKDFR
jgi:hypothetical protein